ncbi:uncharacterized protein MONOS_10365 [Monocercomonoides exilis]|uniref:uncharacterized protein n=1 Tax=Monocercomonoides exilis TaxID=2049356 RepID=UPI00355A570A|nr:hypothetical protein MONOS_10365 [Monocercomonoides exilis]|eukprot:MONOS_10365.1-p1 / transcript=MONOS_10365.1 / gene=MONOS_10365 / organism=Monocercomonoides_exilis_PA203 / gene_product=unspecified product / transcript_product=unspecified product / location=Mono_scaffold00468:14017-15788(+) / protein_length=470 / sequence_SO=supercontig / SO=protein_coding / is_pseudo=false
MHNSEKLYEKKGYYTYLNLNERKYNSSQNNRSSECCSKLLEANEVIHNSINLISHALLSDTSQDHISSFAQSAISSIPFSLQERAKESCYGTTGKKITVPSICVQSSLQTKCANSYDSEEGRSERSFPFFSSSCMPFNEKRHSTVRPTMDTISSNMSLSELFPLFQMQASDIKVACEFHQKYKHPKITFSIDSQKELNSSVSDAIVNENREADVIEYQKVNLIMGWEKDDKEQNTLKPQVSSLIKENKCIQQESFSSFDLKKHEQKRLSIIRKQITEARRFRDLFGVWVRKPWITDELEGKMWDEAEQNSDDEKEGTGKERQTLEEMKSMLIEAQEAGALPEEQRRLEKAIERKEKELEEEAKKSEMTGIERFEEAIAERSKGNEGKNEKESGRFFEMKRFVFNAAAPASHSRNIQTSPQPKQSQTRSFSFSSAEKNETKPLLIAILYSIAQTIRLQIFIKQNINPVHI